MALLSRNHGSVTIFSPRVRKSPVKLLGFRGNERPSSPGPVRRGGESRAANGAAALDGWRKFMSRSGDWILITSHVVRLRQTLRRPPPNVGSSRHDRLPRAACDDESRRRSRWLLARSTRDLRKAAQGASPGAGARRTVHSGQTPGFGATRPPRGPHGGHQDRGAGRTPVLAWRLTGDATRATRRNKSVIPRTRRDGGPPAAFRTARSPRPPPSPGGKTAGRRLIGEPDSSRWRHSDGARRGRREPRRKHRFGRLDAGACWDFARFSRGSG